MNMVNLAALTLLRNDPVVAEGFLQAAARGDVAAHYGMGLIYAEGRGVEQDDAKSFYWLTRDIEQCENGADVLRKVVATGMTAEQYARVELLLQGARLVRIQARGKDHR